MLNLLGLELQMVTSNHVSVENQTLSLWRAANDLTHWTISWVLWDISQNRGLFLIAVVVVGGDDGGSGSGDGGGVGVFQNISTQPAQSMWCYLYVYDFMADHFVLYN